MINARAIVFAAPGRVELRAVRYPDPGPGDAVVETIYSNVSVGTERRVLAGNQSGAPAHPFIAGYSAIGRVTAVGAGVDAALVGRVVMHGGSGKVIDLPICWGAHVSRAVVVAAGLHVIPDGVTPLAASILRTASIAGRGVRIIEPTAGRDVVVVGLGPIGLVAALLHRAAGARVLALATSAPRVEIARRAGLDARVVVGPLAEFVRSILPAGADVLVECTGDPTATRASVDCLFDTPWTDDHGPGPLLVIQGSYTADCPIPYTPAFLKELRMIVPRFDTRADREWILEHIRTGRLDVSELTREVYSPEDAPAVYANLQDPARQSLTAHFRWSAAE